MRPLSHFLTDLRKRHIRLWLDGGDLCYSAPNGALSGALLAELKQRKAEVVAFLQTAVSTPTATIQPQPRNGRLSYAQERLWFLDQLEPGNPFYNIAIALRLVGQLDMAALQHSLQAIVQRHELLRTAFPDQDGQATQQIAPELSLPLPIIDLRRLTPEAQTAELYQLAQAEAKRPFTLSQHPLLRVTLLQLGPTDHALFLTMHHIIADGWSLGVLVQELGAIYTVTVQNKPSPLPALPIQYADFAIWQREQLQGERLERQLAYWRSQLAGIPPELHLPTARPRPAVQSFKGSSISFTVAPDITAALHQLSRQEGATLFMTLAAALSVLLHRYSSQDDIVIGTPIANRTRPELEKLIGFFVNTLVLRANLTAVSTFRDLLRQMRQTALDAYAHQDLPFEMLVDALQPERDLSRNPLFQVMFALQNAPVGDLSLPNLQVTPLEMARQSALFDLVLDMWEITQTSTSEVSLTAVLEYNTDLFDRTTMERLITHLQTLLAAIATTPDERISHLPLLPDAERHQLLVEFAGPQREYPVDQTIPQLFEAQVALTPERIAVSHNGRSLTYAQLNQQANQLAYALRQTGLQANQFVAILEERGLEFLAAILGTLKAGGAYIPIDPAYPPDRVQYMLTNSQAKWLITRSSLLEKVNLAETAVSHVLPVASSQYPVPSEQLSVNSEQYPVPSSQSPISNPPLNSPRDRAYMLYTSGSTGLPKGAIIRHDGAINHIYGEFELLKFHPGTAFLQSAPSSSDISVWQFLGPVLCGGRCVIADLDTVADPARLLNLLQTEKITLIELVPVVLKGLLDYAAALPADKATLPHLEWAMVTGEAVQAPLINQWLALYPHIPIVNAYGPTEAADDVTQQVIRQPLPLDGRSVSIGRPLPNLHILILDAHNQLVPIGVSGELCVAGIGVGEGYWRNPQKTAESFVPMAVISEQLSVNSEQSLPTVHRSLFTHSPHFYRTGDRGRWLPDGTIEFWGRQDDQVKLRGYRIELGEIETRLLQVMGVETAVVLLKGQQLVAYLAGQPQETDYLRQQLRHALPDHMVPSQFIWLDTMPLTPNGKVDRKQLRHREDGAYVVTTTYAPPRNNIERQLVDSWAEVLAAKQVGIQDNFFDLGGHSLKAMQVVSRIHQALDVKISLRDFFAHPTIAEQARLIATSQTEMYAAIYPAATRAFYPLSHAQKRLWLQHQLDKTGAYNMPEAYLIEDELDIDALERTFRDIIQRHEALRTAFVLVDGEPMQQILPTVPFAIRRLDLLAAADADAVAKTVVDEEASKLFDLTQPPLLRATFIKMAERRHIFVLTVHHIIGDGWSGTVLYQEIMALYEAHRQKRPNPLSPLRIQYKDFALWQLEKGFAREEAYWLAKLADVPDYLRLPTDFPVPMERDFRGSMVQVVINGRITHNLHALAQKQQTTLANVMLTLFKLLLYQITKQADLCVGVAIANRNHPDLENLLGFFVNILPLRTQLTDEMEFADLLNQVTEGMNQAFEYQDYPFDLLVEKLNPTRFANRTPILNVIYGFQSFSDVVVGGKQVENRGNGRLSSFHFTFETAKFDLTLFVLADSAGMTLTLEYDTSLFKPQTIQRYLNALARFAEKVGN